MIDDRRRARTMPRGVAATGLLLALVLAACGSTSGTTRPSAAVPSNAATSPSPSSQASTPAGSTSAAASSAAAGQTDTEWGRIWDSLPSGFPTYAGSTPADEAATGPASAVLAVDGGDAKAISTWMATQLEGASYSTDVSGPLENGSYVVDANRALSECHVQVTAAPLGSLTTVTVMYGAACPHD